MDPRLPTTAFSLLACLFLFTIDPSCPGPCPSLRSSPGHQPSISLTQVQVPNGLQQDDDDDDDDNNDDDNDDDDDDDNADDKTLQ